MLPTVSNRGRPAVALYKSHAVALDLYVKVQGHWQEMSALKADINGEAELAPHSADGG